MDVRLVAGLRYGAGQDDTLIARHDSRRSLVGIVRRTRNQIRAHRPLIENVDAGPDACAVVSAAKRQEIVDLTVGGVECILDPIVGGPDVPTVGAIARAGDQHAFVMAFYAEPLAERDEAALVPRLVPREVGGHVVEPRAPMLGQHDDTLET